MKKRNKQANRQKYLITLFLVVSMMFNCGAQNVAINSTGATPNTSAILDVESTSAGLLLPRMTTIQRDLIVSPANSLMIFNITNQCLQIYINTQWQNIFCDGNCFVAPNIPSSISGNTSLCESTTGEIYSTPTVSGATSYTWTVPAGAIIVSGQGSTSITVNFGSTSGNVSVTANNTCGASIAQNLAITLIPITGLQAFTYTGSDQTYTIPPTCANFVKIQCWGAAAGTWGAISGAGGYSEAIFDLNTSVLSFGQTITVMVGEGGGITPPAAISPNTYGFGGGSQSLFTSTSVGSASGGGLSGVFIGTTPILVTDNARAVVVAGGGGGTGEDDCFSTNFRLYGGSGNDVVNAGGMTSMQGVDGSSGSGCANGGYGGGGGGYNGGAFQNRSGGTGTVFGGNGGTGFIDASATTPSILFTPEFSGTPPNTVDPNYNGTAGLNTGGTAIGNNGLVVITFY